MICLSLAVMAFTGSGAAAQTPGQDSMPKPPPELKTLSFGFEVKSFTRLEVEPVSTNTATIPTGVYAYRSEFGGEPARGREYYEHKAERIQEEYAVLRVRNDGAKTIAAIDWEFTFPRFKGDKEIVYYQARNRFKILPGQVASLAQKLPDDGSGVRHIISGGRRFIARSFGRTHRKTTGIYPLEARIKQVRYTDGTVWKASP
ncbi:MAG TPA: hypothetical protein VNO70_21565 [Blastocatellia bacterium]|nr:hypothetical protein [Blastocatellia bacterium]